jgi:signal transduction histidine kinase
VGLDAAPLVRVGVTAARRTIVVGAVLAIVGLLGGAVAFTLRLRDREREAAVARLAESEEARRRGERLAAAGALAAGLAHEVRSPLNAIGMAAQRILRRHAEDSECAQFATTIRAEVGRLDGILKGFLDLARPGSGERVETGLLDLARDVAGLLEPEAQAAGVRLVAAGEAVTLAADRDAVRRAILNLVRNAIVVSPADSTVEIAVEIAVERAEKRARIAVRDRGPGVPGDLRDRLFEPFVSGRTDGTGLGLALVRRIAEEHGGAVHLADREGGGAEAVLELPMTQGAVR